ncbi:MAG: hypothetical protein HYX65_06980 [Gemmatimonadetes bacterium]|nr:hypothetical protein [Gemmatimonadota bacterium]
MTSFFCYDDARARGFEPFALTRPACELRAGAELLRRRWEMTIGTACTGFLGAPHLASFDEPWGCPAATGVLRAGSIVVNSRCAVSLAARLDEGEGWACEGEVAAVRLAADTPASAFADGRITLTSLARMDGAVTPVAGRWIGDVWELVGLLAAMLAEDIPVLADELMASHAPSHVTVIGSHPVWVEGGATVEPMVVLDVSAGPILLRKGATVQSFTRLVGPSVIGAGSTVAGDRIACVSVGETCKVHGEVSTSIFLGHGNKGHDGFVGHSIVGRWVNLGAGTTTSNLKNTYGTVALWTPAGVRDSGLQFLGTMFGDHVKTGIGVRLTTGCVLGAAANVFDRMPPKAVAPFSWGSGAPYAAFALDKCLEIAGRVMSRRHVELGARGRALLEAAHARATQAAYAAAWEARG